MCDIIFLSTKVEIFCEAPVVMAAEVFTYFRYFRDAKAVIMYYSTMHAMIMCDKNDATR